MFSCQVEADAALLITQIVINLPSQYIVVVSEDIDVLVLLTARTSEDRKIYFWKKK